MMTTTKVEAKKLFTSSEHFDVKILKIGEFHKSSGNIHPQTNSTDLGSFCVFRQRRNVDAGHFVLHRAMTTKMGRSST